MFFYDTKSTDRVGTTWRPDLVPTILDWIDNIPAEALPHLRKLRVDNRGHFCCTFSKRADDGGPPRDVEIELDHDGYVVSCGSVTLLWPTLQQFDINHLLAAVKAANHASAAGIPS